jgi:hypothetical protein
VSSDFRSIGESKSAWRRAQAQRPIEEKLAILEKLRDRARTLQAATRRKKDTAADAGPKKRSVPSRDESPQ